MSEVLTRVDEEARGFTEQEWRTETANNERWVQHQRLRSAVVEAAKAWRSATEEEMITNGAHDELFDYERPLFDAGTALIAFESEHGIGEK